MIVIKSSERIFTDSEEENYWWAMLCEENCLDLEVEAKKRTVLETSEGYYKLYLAAIILGFEDDAKRLYSKISTLYDPMLSTNPITRFFAGLAVLGAGKRGTNN